MNKYVMIFFLSLGLISCDPKDVQRALDAVGDAMNTPTFNVADGLKEALNFGVDNSVKKLSAQNGFYKSIYKIILPEDAKKVINALKIVPGFEKVEETIIQKINQSAEDAASKAGPIFIGAIKSITFDDATNILMGAQNAATQFLHNRTFNALYGEFNPVINNSLNKFGALDYWADAVNAYNKLPLVKKLNPDISDHVTTKALDGLFKLIEKKEQGIRTDISQRTTDLLKNVFAKQDK